MAEAKGKKKILWAVDLFAKEEAVMKSAAWSIRALVKGGGGRVQPVYVWSQASYEVPTAPADTKLLKTLQQEGQEAIERILTRIEIPGLEPFKILPQESSSVRGDARALVNYAKEVGADLIVVSSHGRKGVKRWILGSFAETLSLYSDVPLLIVHPNWKRTPDFKSILFLTDFSRESQAAFDEVLEFAAERKSRITLFHKLGSIGYPVFDSAFTTYAYYEQAIREEFSANRRLANQMIERGKERGVRVTAVFDRSKESITDAVLKRSQRLGSMIAMVSQSGPVSSVVMGSTTRQIVRSSEQPVWVIHPHREKQTQVKPLGRGTQEDLKTGHFQQDREKTA